jgi:hypothetical protein
MQLSIGNRSYSRRQRPKAPTAPAAGLRLYSLAQCQWQAGAGAVAAGTARQQPRAVNDGRCRRFLGGLRARRPPLRGVADGQPTNGAEEREEAKDFPRAKAVAASTAEGNRRVSRCRASAPCRQSIHGDPKLDLVESPA